MKCPNCDSPVPNSRRSKATCSAVCARHRRKALLELRPNACRRCQGPIPDARRRRNAKLCSEQCSKAEALGAYGSTHEAKISTASAGAAAELLVCAVLLRAGWSVYRAVSPSAPHDLAIFGGGQFLRVEVTSGFEWAATQHVQHPAKSTEHSDWLAVVLRLEDVLWFKATEAGWSQEMLPSFLG
jgi:hypothetical protein